MGVKHGCEELQAKVAELRAANKALTERLFGLRLHVRRGYLPRAIMLEAAFQAGVVLATECATDLLDRMEKARSHDEPEVTH